ncbi:MAG: chromosome segregation protein SMC [Lachnospirales bacterium]
MYLKKIELQGFKSFPEKIIFEFNKGITSIVGPNGSGKSNVSDSIRWVLGEQSAKSLRGDKMEDVIFAGTANRRALGFAEVSLYLDNSDGLLALDFREVKVTRKVFRNGDSAYSINGVNCRLKDVQELFMDTGIGKEGYSIIGQGKIDEILKSKSEDRRLLFEEATGIVKYRSRKKESESKLAKERENLDRLKDIILEIENQLEPLKKQSENAIKYNEYYEKLKLYTINLFLMENTNLIETLEIKKNELNELNYNLDETKREEINKRDELEKKGNKYKIVIDEIENNNNEENKLNLEINNKENEIKVVKEQINNNENNVKNLILEIEKNKNKLADMEVYAKEEAVKLEKTVELLKNVKEEKSAKEKEYEELNQFLIKRENELKELNVSIVESSEKIKNITEKCDIEEELYESISDEKEEILSQIGYYKSKIEEANNDIKNIRQVLEEEKSKERDLIDREKIFLTKKFETEIKYKEANINKNDVNHKFSEINGRISTLQNLEKEHHGFFDSVKYVLNKKHSGVLGVIGELLEVPKEYEEAIEVALGGRIQNIITENEDVAKEIIEDLKENKKGRCTFLPLTSIRYSLVNPPKEEGVIGIASEIIQYNKLIGSAVKSLLGKTIIVDKIENAIAVSKKYKNSFRIVTLTGEEFNIGGSMTGGSRGKNKSQIFSRSREINEGEEKLKYLKAELVELSESCLKFEKDLERINSEQGYIREEMESSQRVFNEKSNELNKINLELEYNTKLLNTKIEEDDKLTKAILEKNNLIRGLYEEIKLLEQSKIKYVEELNSFENNMENNKDEKDRHIKKLIDISSKISKLEENVTNIKENVLRIKKEEEELKIEVLKQNNKKVELESSVKDKNSIINEIENEIELTQENLIELVENKKEKLVLKEKLSILIENLEMEVKAIEKRINVFENSIIKMENTIENLDKDIMLKSEKIWNEYELTLRGCKDFEEDFDEEFLRENIVTLKTDLKNLGHVNFSAIEQYEETRERYEFLTKQKADIEESEKKLKGIIEELIKLMEEQFSENFQIIRENFKLVFKDIFQGGEADLVLDNKDVLNSGISIVAKPPGKKLTNLNLLSGGERALTAIALLFSILRMKPSPFCVLDEIEAALDDANVDRYANFLRRFSDTTQFILITHRKGTMEIADVLYGVTMEEQGISKLVSVELE